MRAARSEWMLGWTWQFLSARARGAGAHCALIDQLRRIDYERVDDVTGFNDGIFYDFL